MTPTRIIVIDDMEVRHRSFARRFQGDEVVHCRSSEEFFTALRNQPRFDFAFLDHDLEEKIPGPYGSALMEVTGTDLARFIACELSPEKRPGAVIIHSWNPPGAVLMREILRDAGVPVVYDPFIEYKNGEHVGTDGGALEEWSDLLERKEGSK